MALALEAITEGKYEILGKIAEGGVGAIYKVRHRLLDEIRAIKVLHQQHSDKDEIQRRFLREARTAIKLKHPNIAHLHDFAVSQEGTAYIVMEYIDGIELDKVLTACGPPSLELSVELGRQTLDALAYLHGQGFVHRDISPDNLMLTRDHQGQPLVKLIDLGIVKNLSGGAGLTATGMFIGKVKYCSPEQFSTGDNQVPIDHRSDNYSFGVMFYELLTGRHPIAGDNFAELAGGHLFHPPLDFRESDPQGKIPRRMRKVILKSLAKEPDKRIGSADEFNRRISAFRKPGPAIEAEFSEVFERARRVRSEPSAQPQGTTQGRLDREFGVDRTTASGKTSADELAQSAEAPPPPEEPPAPKPPSAKPDPMAFSEAPTRPMVLPSMDSLQGSQPDPTQPLDTTELPTEAPESLETVPIPTGGFLSRPTTEEPSTDEPLETEPVIEAEPAAETPAAELVVEIPQGTETQSSAPIVESIAQTHEPEPQPEPAITSVDRPPSKSKSKGRFLWFAAVALVAAGAVWYLRFRPEPEPPAEPAPAAQVVTRAPSLPAAAKFIPTAPTAADSTDVDEPPAQATVPATRETQRPTPAASQPAPAQAEVNQPPAQEPAITRQPTPGGAATALDPSPQAAAATTAPEQSPETVAEVEPEPVAAPPPVAQPVAEPAPPEPVIVLPRITRRVAAEYPAAARRRSLRATVIVEVLVSGTGSVVQTRVVQGDSSRSGFNRAAVAAAIRTGFAPGTRDGVISRMWTEIRFDFAP